MKNREDLKHYQFWSDKTNLENDELKLLYEKGNKLFQQIYDILTDKQKDQFDKIIELLDMGEVFDKW